MQFYLRPSRQRLHRALLWVSVSDAERRKDNQGCISGPSWSWAGWIGRSHYRDECISNRSKCVNAIRSINSATNHLISNEDARKDSTKPTLISRRFKTNKSLIRDHAYCPRNKNHEMVRGPLPSLQQQGILHSNNHLVSTEGLDPEKQLLSNELVTSEGGLDEPVMMDASGHLHVVAKCANLILSGYRTYPSEYSLFTEDRFVSGYVSISGDEIASGSFSRYRFIRLSLLYELPDWPGENPEPKGPYDTTMHNLPPLEDISTHPNETTVPDVVETFESLVRTRYPSIKQYEDTWEAKKCLYLNMDPFGLTKFDSNKPWSCYNIMIIEWRDGVAYRIGLGVCHADAFDAANPVWKRITLG